MNKNFKSLVFIACFLKNFLFNNEILIKVNNSSHIRKSLQGNNLPINLILQKRFTVITQSEVKIPMEIPRVYEREKTLNPKKKWFNIIQKQKKYIQLSFWIINIRRLYNDFNTFLNTIFNGRYAKPIQIMLITTLLCIIILLVFSKFLNRHFNLRNQNLDNIISMAGIKGKQPLKESFTQYKQKKNVNIIQEIEKHLLIQ